MRIVHLIGYFQPALGYQETHLARQQLKRGHEVTVLCSDRFYPFPNYDGTIRPLLGDRVRSTGRFEEEGVPVWRLPIRYESEARKRCWMIGVREALEELCPDVVHSHNVAEIHTVQAARYQPDLGYRLVVDSHDLWVSIQTGLAGRVLYGGFRATFSRMIVRRSEALVAFCDQTAEIMKSVFGLRGCPVPVIELGVDSDLFAPDEAAGLAVREKLGLTPGDFLIVYTGKLIPSKGPHLILEALAQCPSSMKALFVGNGAGAYMDGMRATVTELGLEERVFFEPACPQVELPRYYAAADAGCWPREASMAMLEAASCAVPIVVIQEGLEARVANRNGLVYPEGNSDALAKALKSLFEDRDGARAMGRRGRDLVERSFTWNQINLQFEDLYRGADS